MSWTTAQKKCCRSDYESCPIKKIIHGVFLLGHQCRHGKRRYALIFRQGIENSTMSCRDAGSYSSAHGLFPPGVPETQPLIPPTERTRVFMASNDKFIHAVHLHIDGRVFFQNLHFMAFIGTVKIKDQAVSLSLISEIQEWVYCPVCGNKTRLRLREDTVLTHFPLFCPKCKKESLIDAKEYVVKEIK